MVDGDGWVTCKGRNVVLGLCGSKACCDKFREYVLDIVPECGANVTKIKNIWKFATSGRNAIPVIQELYQDDDLALARKAKVAGRISRSAEWLMDSLATRRSPVFNIGEKYNMLSITAIEKVGNRTYARCDCECGSKGVLKRLDGVRSGHTRSCGCL